jgi:hypothetical protein
MVMLAMECGPEGRPNEEKGKHHLGGKAHKSGRRWLTYRNNSARKLSSHLILERPSRAARVILIRKPSARAKFSP